MLFHPHLHAIVTAGGLSLDGSRWIDVPNDNFLFPVVGVSKVFRGKFLDGFIELWKAGEINLTERESRKLVRKAKKHDWVVFAKKPFGGPAHIVNYLGRYTHRVGISSSRLVSISDEKIIRTRGEKTCSLAPEEFIRRFLLHVLPLQFFKIRHYGLLAPANVNTRLARAQDILGPTPAQTEPLDPGQQAPEQPTTTAADHRTATTALRDDPKAVDRAAPACPHCGGRLAALTPRRVHFAYGPPPDT